MLDMALEQHMRLRSGYRDSHFKGQTTKDGAKTLRAKFDDIQEKLADLTIRSYSLGEQTARPEVPSRLLNPQGETDEENFLRFGGSGYDRDGGTGSSSGQADDEGGDARRDASPYAP
jgi:hypothetical protein